MKTNGKWSNFFTHNISESYVIYSLSDVLLFGNILRYQLNWKRPFSRRRSISPNAATVSDWHLMSTTVGMKLTGFSRCCPTTWNRFFRQNLNGWKTRWGSGHDLLLQWRGKGQQLVCNPDDYPASNLSWLLVLPELS